MVPGSTTVAVVRPVVRAALLPEGRMAVRVGGVEEAPRLAA